MDQVMDRYKGREDEFFGILRRKYGIEAGSPDNDPLGIADLSRMSIADQDARYSDFTSLNSDSNAISSTTSTARTSSGSGGSVWELGTKHERCARGDGRTASLRVTSTASRGRKQGFDALASPCARLRPSKFHNTQRLSSSSTRPSRLYSLRWRSRESSFA